MQAEVAVSKAAVGSDPHVNVRCCRPARGRSLTNYWLRLDTQLDEECSGTLAIQPANLDSSRL